MKLLPPSSGRIQLPVYLTNRDTGEKTMYFIDYDEQEYKGYSNIYQAVYQTTANYMHAYWGKTNRVLKDEADK